MHDPGTAKEQHAKTCGGYAASKTCFGAACPPPRFNALLDSNLSNLCHLGVVRSPKVTLIYGSILVHVGIEYMHLFYGPLWHVYPSRIKRTHIPAANAGEPIRVYVGSICIINKRFFMLISGYYKVLLTIKN